MAENVNIELVIQAGKSAQTLGEIKQSIKDVTQALKDTKVGTDEFNKLKEVFQANRANIKAMRQEFADLKQVETVAKTLTASFAVASSAIGIFGSNTEKAEKAVRQLEGAFVLMESVQKLARSFREAAIANETFNKSLLTNPYTLVATAIIGIGLAIYTYVNDTEAATEATKKLAESAQMLNEVKLDSLKDKLDEIAKKNKDGIDDAQQELELVKLRKGSVEEEFAAKQKVNDLTKKDAQQQLALFGEKEKAEIEGAKRRKEVFTEQSELLDKERKALDAVKDRSTKVNDDAAMQHEKNIKILEDGLKTLKDQNTVTSERVELYEKLNETISKADRDKTTSAAEANEKKREERLKEAHEEELKRIKEVQKANQDLQDTEDKEAELRKAQGDTDKEVSDFKISALGKEIIQNTDLIKTEDAKVKASEKLLAQQRKGSEEYNATLENLKAEKENLESLNKLQGDLIQKKAVEIEVNKKLVETAKQEDAVKAIDEQDKAYDRLEARLKNVTDVMKAKGAKDDEISKVSIDNNNQLIGSVQKEIAAVELSAETDEEKAKKVEELRKKITELKDANNVLNASLAKKPTSIFGDATKEVQKVTTEASKIAPVISKVEALATQIVSQNVQRRIALYEHQNQMYVKGLDTALQQGFLSQQQYNQKVAAAEAELKKKEREEQHKEFVAKKATGIVNATIQTALGVMQALANTPPPASYVLAAVAGAMGGAEIAEIAAQKEPPSYAVGGTVEGLGTATSDSIRANLSNGESVINARSTKMFAPLLSAVNQIGGGVALKGTESIKKSPSGQISSSQPSAPSAPQKVYVVESDITKTQRRVQVAQNRSKF